MPRVSESHKNAQRRRILDAARRSFSANGFHQTSMGDLVEESGLSAGAIYRYFPTKEAIISAIAGEAVGRISAPLMDLLDEDNDVSLETALTRLLSAIDGLAEQGAAGLAIQVWGEAQRDPALAEMARAEFTRLRDQLASLVARASGSNAPDGSTNAAAQALFSLLPGYLLQRVVLGPLDPEAVVDALATLFAET